MEKEETPKRLAPTKDTLRSLFAKSGNQCAFPGCVHLLIDEDENFVGQVCHIEDALEGCRYNPEMSNEERRSVENLVLFCYRHHVKTNDERQFPVPKLKEIKQAHEKQFSTEFQVSDGILSRIFYDLQNIITKLEGVQSDTSSIISMLVQQSDQISRLSTFNSGQEEIGPKSDFSERLKPIIKMRKSNHQKVALSLLEDIKAREYQSLSDEEKFQLQINIGICHLELGQPQQGAKFLISGESLTPNTEHSLGYAALGFAIMGNTNESESLLRRCLEMNSRNIDALVALSIVGRDKLSYKELLDQIPLDLHDHQTICYSIGVFARKANDYSKAIHWFQKSVDNASYGSDDLKANLATTILISVFDPAQILTGYVDHDTRNKIKYCIELFNDSWANLKEGDLQKSRTSYLINRGIAKKIIGDKEGAYEDINLATNIHDDFFNRRHLVIASLETGRIDLAIERLQELRKMPLLDAADGSQMAMLTAEAFSRKKMFSEALDVLNMALNEAEDKQFIGDLRRAKAGVLINGNDLQGALEISLENCQREPNILRNHIAVATIYEKLQDNASAIKQLKSAMNLISMDTSAEDFLDFTEQLNTLGEYNEVIKLLEPRSEDGKFTSINRNLLEAYFQAGEFRKALELSNTIAENHSPIALITEVQSEIYETIGDLSQAIAVCERYLDIYPDDAHVSIRLASVFHRKKDFVKLKEVLNNLKVTYELPFELLYRVAAFHQVIGENRKGLEIAYQTRKNYSGNGDAHAQYVQFVLFFKKEPKADIISVENNCTVKLKDSTGSTFSFSIVNDQSQLAGEEIHKSSYLAQLFLGKKVGEKVKIQKGTLEGTELEIDEILDKYSFASQQSIEALSTRFIDTEGFWAVKLEDSSDPKNRFQQIFESVDQRDELNMKINGLYRENGLTIGICASLAGVSPIKYWSTVVSDKRLGILSEGAGYSTTHPALIEELSGGRGLVLDLISILSFASIEELSLFERISNHKVVGVAVIDEFEDIIADLEGPSSEGFFSIEKVDGHYVKNEFSKERLNKLKQFYKDIVGWIKGNCEIVPCTEALSMNASTKSELDSHFGKSFIDSILICKELNYVYLSDEVQLRDFAFQEFEVEGISSFSLLRHLQDQEQIKRKDKDTCVSKLINLGYKNLLVNSNVLINCAENAEFKPTHPFSRAVESLDSSVCTENSAIRVAVDFFYQLFAMINLPQIRIGLITPILIALFKGRNRESVYRKMITLIDHRFRVIQKQKDELLLIIDDFLQI